ncbi:excinuclease ABC subunit UvrC [Candidatus Margulisiibacteriota bacterium]
MGKKGLELQAKEFPHKPGVYLFKDKKSIILYIGKAVDLRKRIVSYFRSDVDKDRLIVRSSASVECIVTNLETEALILESTLARKYQPRYNIRLKDDKSFPYIKITSERYPRVVLTRRFVKGDGEYFGPFISARDAHKILRLIHDHFMIRKNSGTPMRKRKKPCLRFHLGKCLGPCFQDIDLKLYADMIVQVRMVLTGRYESLLQKTSLHMKKLSKLRQYEQAQKYKERIEALELLKQKQLVFKDDLGDRDVAGFYEQEGMAVVHVFQMRSGFITGRYYCTVENIGLSSPEDVLQNVLISYYADHISNIPREIVLPFTVPFFTEALPYIVLEKRSVKVVVPQRGAKKDLLSLAEHNAKIILSKKLVHQQSLFLERALVSLQEALSLSGLPLRISCIDISHTAGTSTMGSMVQFYNGKPDKKQYRLFTIKSLAEGRTDDYAAIREVVTRYIKRIHDAKEPRPDLIVIDGGKGQLSQAVAACGKEAIPLISIAKRNEEIFVPRRSLPLSFARYPEGKKLIMRIRDEAHRFAITRHRKKRMKKSLNLIK